MKVLSFDLGLRNLAWCLLDYAASGEFTILDWNVESCLDDSVNVNATSLELLVGPFVTLMTRLFQTTDLKGLDALLIESQPMGHGRSFGGTSMGGSPRNLKTKVLSHVVQAMALQQGFTNIHFISPMLKLRECPIPFRERNYRDNKKWAIEKTSALIEGRSIETFVGSKRDDLADAFLQAQQVCKLVTEGSMNFDPATMIFKKEKKRVRVDKEENQDKPVKKRKTEFKSDSGPKMKNKKAESESGKNKSAESPIKEKKPKVKKVTRKAHAEIASALEDS